MLRAVVICTLAGWLLAGPAGAARQLMPGVTYDKQVQFTRRGAVVLHVLVAPRPTGDYRLETALSNGVLAGRDRLTGIQRRVPAPVVGVSGDFSYADGRPNGIVIQNGALASGPISTRASLGVDAAGNLRVARVRMAASWNGTSQRRPVVAINKLPGRNGVALFTPAWGGTTPPAGDTVEVALSGFPPALPDTELGGSSSEVRQGGGTRIPPDGAVLVGRGTGGQALAAEAPVGTPVAVRLPLAVTPDWGDAVSAIGGGPELVRGGKPIFRIAEAFSPLLLATRQPRAAVGQRADGRLLLVVADGGRFGYSVGMTNSELARALDRLGAVTAFAFAPGAAATLASDGRLLNRPSTPNGGLLADALLLRYRAPAQ